MTQEPDKAQSIFRRPEASGGATGDSAPQPLICMICDKAFWDEEAADKHAKDAHGLG